MAENSKIEWTDHTFKLGKKAAGRRLDGVEHNGLPAYWPSRERGW